MQIDAQLFENSRYTSAFWEHQGQVQEERLYCGSVAAAVPLMPTSAKSLWTQLDPQKPLIGWLVPASTNFSIFPPTSTKPSQFQLKLHHLSTFSLVWNSNESACQARKIQAIQVNPLAAIPLSQAVAKTRQANPEERSHWSEGEHCHLLNTCRQQLQ